MEWIREATHGLSLMFEFARDAETMGKAVDAFLEVTRLQMELSETGGRREGASR